MQNILKSVCLKVVNKSYKKTILIAILILFLLLISFTGIAYAVSDGASYGEQDSLDLVGSSQYLNQNKNTDVHSQPVTDNSDGLKDYIKSNADSNMTAVNKYCPGTLMILKQTLVDNNKLSGISTLNQLHSDINNNAELAIYESYCVLYNLDDESPYYVGYINNTEGNVLDIVFAKNNYDGEVLDDCIYDWNTGLIYVPKTYTKGKGEDCKESLLEMQAQTLVAVEVDDDGKVATKIDIKVDSDFERDAHSTVKANALDTEICIPVGEINREDISVVANDNVNLNSVTSYEDGVLYVGASSASITSIEISTHKSGLFSVFANEDSSKLSGSVDDLLPLPYTLNGSLNATSSPTGKFNCVGAKYNSIQTVHYDEKPSSSPYQDRLYGVRGFVTDADIYNFAHQIWDDTGDVDLSSLSVVSDRQFNLFTFYQVDIYKYFVDSMSKGLAMKCGHIATPASHDVNNKEVRVKILALNEDKGYAVLGFTSATAGYTQQGGCAIYKVLFEGKGGVCLDKVSKYSWSTNNTNYSLENCKFNVYSDEGCTQSTGVSLTTNKDGYATTDNNALRKGTYYLKEDSSVHGQGYLRNSTSIGKVNIESNTIKKAVWKNAGDSGYVSPSCVNTPIDNPDMIEIAKCDKQIGVAEKPAGSAKLSDAHYEFTYYQEKFQKSSEAASYSPIRSWVMKTNQYGYTSLSFGKDYKVSGDDFFYKSDGSIAIPLGSYVVREMKAPEGYEMSDKVYIINNVLNGGKVESHVYDGSSGVEYVGSQIVIDQHTGKQAIKATEQVKRGDYNFSKVNTERKAMSGIPFLISSVTTGEKHVVVSDVNGNIDTSSNHVSHSHNTNINDAFVDLGSGTVKDEEGLNPDSGCWFSGTASFSTPADDSVCALPYDTYTVQELVVSKNQQYQPFPTRTFTISKEGYNIKGSDWVNSTSALVTNAHDAVSESNWAYPNENELVFDKISYSGFLPGTEYVIKSWLIEKSTGGVVSLKDGTDGQNYVLDCFTPDTVSGSRVVSATVDTRNYVGKTLVWFTEVTLANGIKVCEHINAEDAQESITVLESDMETFLHVKDSPSQNMSRINDLRLVDDIVYSGLQKGLNYTIHGVLYDMDTGVPYVNEITGAAVEATCSFNAEDKFGTTRIEYSLNSSMVPEGKVLVSCVDLLLNDTVIKSMHSLNDKKEQVVMPKTSISTELVFGDSKNKSAVAQKNTDLRDLLNYAYLPVSKTCSVYSWLVNSKTGLPVTDGQVSEDEAKAIIDEFIEALGGRVQVSNNYVDPETGEFVYEPQWIVTFEGNFNKVDMEAFSQIDFSKMEHIAFVKNEITGAESGNKSLPLSFDFSSTPAQNMTAMTVITSEDNVVAHDTDIANKNETVELIRSSISTVLTDFEENKEITLDKEIMLKDTVEYKNCIEGKTYVLKGVLVKKDDLSEIAESQTEFKAEGSEGFTEVDFQVTSSSVGKSDLVAYEYLYLEDTLAAKHEDPNNESQTVFFKTPEQAVLGSKSSATSGPKTGDFIWRAILVLSVAGLAGAMVYLYIKRKRQGFNQPLHFAARKHILNKGGSGKSKLENIAPGQFSDVLFG